MKNTISSLLESFLSTFQSQNTRKSYGADLKEFFLFCQNDINLPIDHPEQITEKLVFVWQKKLNPLSNATAARKIATLSSFLEYLCKKKEIPRNFMKDINRPKVEKNGKTNVLDQKELEQILSCTWQNAQFYQGKKYGLYKLWFLRYVVLCTLFSVGMRVEELCSLKIKDLERLDEDHWRLHLMAKGGEEHAPIIHKKTALLLKDYIQQFRSFAQKDDFLFVSSCADDVVSTDQSTVSSPDEGASSHDEKVSSPRNDLSSQKNDLSSPRKRGSTPLHRTSVFHMIKTCAKEAGIEKNISPHSCRATLATLLHQNGVPIAQIQSLLNHKQMTTTSIYIKKSDELAHAAATKIDLL